MNFKQALVSCTAFLLGIHQGIAHAGTPTAWERDIDGYKLSFPAQWQASEADDSQENIVARQFQGDQRIGEIMAATLSRSVQFESNEMADSPKRNPDAVSLIDSSTVALRNGQRSRTVTLMVNADIDAYRAPVVFYSAYLPSYSGGSVTYKLICSMRDFDRLKSEFDSIWQNSTRVLPGK